MLSIKLYSFKYQKSLQLTTQTWSDLWFAMQIAKVDWSTRPLDEEQQSVVYTRGRYYQLISTNSCFAEILLLVNINSNSLITLKRNALPMKDTLFYSFPNVSNNLY